MIVHGMGICISHGARVGPGVILFQGVTLGEGVDPKSRIVGSPRVESDVHIGPGATLIGPISVGSGSKIMAGCVVTDCVPANSIVEASRPVVRSRKLASPTVDIGDGPAPRFGIMHAPWL
jgi:serine acetyltransferase